MKNSSRYIIILVTLAIVGGVVWYLRSIVGYLLISWVLSLMGQPFFRLYKKIKIGKFQIGNNIAAGMTVLSFLIIVSLIFALFVPMILAQARTIAAVDFATVWQSLEEPIAQTNQRMIDTGLLDPNKDSPLKSLQTDVTNQAGNMITSVFGSVLSITSNLIIGLFSLVFITFFFLKEEGLMQNFLSAFVPNELEKKLFRALDEIKNLLTRYFIGVLGQITIITIIVTLGLMLLGIENALLIAFFAALINVIPYLGPLIGATFGVFIAITSNLEMDFYSQMLPMIGKILMVFAIMQMLDNFVLQPVIFSTSVKAHPLEIFIIILIGAKIYGIFGMVLAIPAYTVIRVIAQTFLIRFKLVQRMTKRLNEQETVDS
ncbi:MAG: AI-2E family transporter [Saprospiraceae bacterium]